MASGLRMAAPLLLLWLAAASGSLYDDFDFVGGGDAGGRMLDNGQLIALSLSNGRGSSFHSKKEYLFGRFSMQLKLIPGYSAGTVTTFYLQSGGTARDEIDFEFLGNLSGEPYVVHTNIYVMGEGEREQQFYLWFDPTKAFHTYSLLWTPRHILFFVDGTPIREFERAAPFPAGRVMRIWGTLWAAQEWATRGGRVHTDWSKGPFTAYYRNFLVESCRRSPGGAATAACRELDAAGRRRMTWVRRKYMIYNYCTDVGRFPRGPPPECHRRHH
ncbi:unnamed protein product [Spirodela intermedia]|uniref:Xyloglucan endotransglucosylase/hydrolase n=1 Tax=Spirodela intermedia TaxID=51605 RepID=A0A7I8LH18_SPIIN|nr:unnamed protein product [Spirodela intermedia]